MGYKKFILQQKIKKKITFNNIKKINYKNKYTKKEKKIIVFITKNKNFNIYLLV